MAVFKINKTNNYTVMSNHHLRNKELSLKAKGLLSVMLSLPQEWDYSIAGLCSIVKENESAVKSALAELKQFKYLVVTKKYANETDSGRIEYQYDVYEEPLLEGEIQPLENLGVETQPEENPGQLNKDNKILNNKIKSIVEVDYSENQVFTNNSNHQTTFYNMKDLPPDKLKQLKQEVLENRDSKHKTYKQIQQEYHLVENITYNTPEDCDTWIQRKQLEHLGQRWY